ncbi:hypothetical protein DFH09DRAFT_1316155 [Mycena vulgaris]|nr:hypothetical protein DFH09DRAFT_1316155 [Mycena vulgaris]
MSSIHVDCIVEAVAPLWFQQWDQQHFKPLVARVDALAAQWANEHRATGHQAPFVIVPFIDGSDPTVAPHALPALRNTNDIRALTPAQSTTYCNNYGILQPGNAANCRLLIAKHIGYYDGL